MIDDLLEVIFPEPVYTDDGEYLWSRGEGMWISFYLWYKRFLPVRMWMHNPADTDSEWWYGWQWRGHWIIRRPKTRDDFCG